VYAFLICPVFTCFTHLTLSDLITLKYFINIHVGLQVIKFFITQFSPPSCYFSVLNRKSTPNFQTTPYLNPQDQSVYLHSCENIDFIFSEPMFLLRRSRNSSVSIATMYRLDDRGVGVWIPVGSIICSSPCCPDSLWGPPSFLSNVYRGNFLRG
jgi:hypothetical protein